MQASPPEATPFLLGPHHVERVPVAPLWMSPKIMAQGKVVLIYNPFALFT